MKTKMGKMLVVWAVVVAGAACALASPLSLPVKAAIRGAEKAGLHAGGHLAGEAAVHGGAALAKATAKHEAAKAVVVGAERSGAHVAGHAAGEAAVHGGAALAKVTAEREAAKAASRSAVGEVVGKVSGKQIVAAGAATALVVGTHEVADGAQTVCEESAAAIRDNPELAPSMVGSVFRPITAVVVLACVAAMAVLAWLLWPLLALARNSIRLAAARRMRAARLRLAMGQEGGQPDGAIGQNGHIGESGYVRVGTLVWLVSAFLLLTALGIWRAIDSGAYVWVVNPSRARTIAGIRDKYDEAVNRHLEAFRADVDATATERFGRVRGKVPHVAEKFGTFSKCAALAKAIVFDKLGGGNRTENEIKEDLEVDYYQGLYDANDAVAGCLVRLKDNLEKESGAFHAEVEKELASEQLLGDEAYRKMLESCGERIESVKRDLAVAQLDAGISVAIETLCIRQTVKTVAGILGRAALRQAGTMAAGAGAACVDGPLPFGDIIGGIAVAGCTAWTAWDVYKATKVMPQRLSGTLSQSVDECERHCREEVLKRGEEMAAAVCSSSAN